MVFFGLSKKLVERWGLADAPGLHNALLCGQGGIVSVEPARLMRGMAEQMQDDEMLTETFCTGSLSQIETVLAGRPDPQGALRCVPNALQRPLPGRA